MNNSDSKEKKVLIIEDNEDLQQVYSFAFQSAGYDVRISGDGLIGVTDVVDYRPDVVLLDIVMPEMNGYEFLDALKNNTSLSMPVIVVSNLSQDKDKDKALTSGADLYLVKSEFEGPDLVAKVSDFLASYRPTIKNAAQPQLDNKYQQNIPEEIL